MTTVGMRPPCSEAQRAARAQGRRDNGGMNKKTPTLDLRLSEGAQWQIAPLADDAPRRFSGIANSGRPFGYGSYQMVVDFDGIRLKDKTAVLIDHDGRQRAGVCTLSVTPDERSDGLFVFIAKIEIQPNKSGCASGGTAISSIASASKSNAFAALSSPLSWDTIVSAPLLTAIANQKFGQHRSGYAENTALFLPAVKQILHFLAQPGLFRIRAVHSIKSNKCAAIRRAKPVSAVRESVTLLPFAQYYMTKSAQKAVWK